MVTGSPTPKPGTIVLIEELHPRRDGLFPPGTRGELWAGLFLIAVAVVGTALVIKCRLEALALERDAVHVRGKVLRLWSTKENNGWHYRVEYEFESPPEFEPRLFHDRTELPKEFFDRLKEDGPIDVKICRTDASNHQVLGERPRAYRSDTTLRMSLGFLGLFAAAGALNLWWWWASRRTAARTA